MNLLRIAGFALTVAIGGAFGALIMTQHRPTQLHTAVAAYQAAGMTIVEPGR